MTKKCIGCGVALQSTNPNEKGYIPKDTKNENRYCMRCFKIMHYNQNIQSNIEYNENELVSIINKRAKLVFFLIDYLNINEETISKYKSIEVPKILLISKSDIIPKNMKKEKVKTWIKDIYKIDDEIEVISSKGKINISRIETIANKQNIKEAYIMGYTNAGKSTLVNTIAINSSVADKKITTSLNPNTTLDFIKLKINDKLTLIDTPGFSMEHSFSNNEIDLIKRINSKSSINPVTYQCKKDMSFNIEDKLVMNFDGNENSITFYMSNSIKINKKFTKNFLTDVNKRKFDIKENQDLVIRGLGFINIKKETKLEIYAEDLDIIEIRDSSF